jgi:molybdopterin molybdotransferase
MNLFLDLISVEEARRRGLSILSIPSSEIISLPSAYGRVLSAPIISDIDIPGFDKTVVDGYAVVSSDTIGASESMPAMLSHAGSVLMGSEDIHTIQKGSCMYTPTGARIPHGSDAVCMIEYAESLGDIVLVQSPVAGGENVLKQGEDFTHDAVVLRAGTIISEREMGVLAATGHAEVSVFKRPVIGIISTGDEIVPVQKVPSGSSIRDVNSYICAGVVGAWGGEPKMYGIVPDEKNALCAMLQEAITECDLILISGGSSKGERDVCAEVLMDLGEILVHGIALSPGKPTIRGVSNMVPIVGLPGHPASAYIVLLALVRAMIYQLAGRDADSAEKNQNKTRAVLAVPIHSARGREE